MQNRINSLHEKKTRAEEISSLSYTLHKIKTQQSLKPKGNLLKKIQTILNQNSTEKQLEEARLNLYQQIWEHKNESIWENEGTLQNKQFPSSIDYIVKKISNTLNETIIFAQRHIKETYINSAKSIKKMALIKKIYSKMKKDNSPKKIEK